MKQPLSGKQILITRSEEQAKPFSEKLTKAGAIPLVAPLLTFQSRLSQQNQEIFQQLHEYTWVFFTSANGVKFFFEQLNYWQVPLTVVDQLQVAVIGTKTEKMLNRYGISADFCPRTFQGNHMVEEFLHKYSADQRILLVCGNLARKEIANGLKQQQVFFRRVIVYDTLINEQAKQSLQTYLVNENIDACTFTSPSTVQAFEELAGEHSREINQLKQEALCVCIGTTTQKKAKQQGFKHIRTPDQFTIDGMLEELVNYFNKEGKVQQ
ncbi:uroporphyrinogen-III synthase [Aquibacillus sediminis]|uniref:uroporphyrinogen-III synthase n=1 Tax=Aquibacillus sediminis TaxID=2574734 RepID=UPI001108EE63|nr:uroporphyrinogen-III synthase [Aquibacillus sediminis]